MKLTRPKRSALALFIFSLLPCSSALAQGLHIQTVEVKEYRVRGKVVLEAEDFLMEMPKELYDALPSKDKTYRVKTTRHLLYVTLPHFYSGPDPVLDDGERHVVKPPGALVEKLRRGLEALKFGISTFEKDTRKPTLAKFKKDVWPSVLSLAAPSGWMPREDLDAKTKEGDRMSVMMDDFSIALGDPRETAREKAEKLKKKKGAKKEETDWDALTAECDRILSKLRGVREWVKLVKVRQGRQIVLYSGKREMAEVFMPKDLHDIEEEKEAE